MPVRKIQSKVLRQRRRRHRRNRRSLRRSQRGAGVGFTHNLEGNHLGNRSQVVRYEHCVLPQKALVSSEPSELLQHDGSPFSGQTNENLHPVKQVAGGKRRRRRRSTSSKRKKRKCPIIRKSKRRSRRNRRRLKQKGGDFNCPTCNTSMRVVDCRQPTWNNKCI